MKKKSNKAKPDNTPKYFTRNQAIRKLQLRLTQFRRLCILKGIHPRDPRKKPKGPGKTYYHVKDILFLAHEPLLKKFREISAHEKKIHKARSKLNNDLAKRLRSRKPSYRLDHLVRERYPSFVDALRDMDDALTLIHLFATLPAEHKRQIPQTTIQISRRLALEWQAYVVKTHSLRKVFIAVKGFYYQAEVMGQTITWLVPHQLSQVLPDDVDFRIMTTFLEFYQTLLQFVNFKLYHMVGASYPPVVDPRLEEAAAGLASIMEDLADPTPNPALPSAASVDEPMDAAANRRLEGLQDKLRELQEQGSKEASAAAGAVEDVDVPEAGDDPAKDPESEDEGPAEIDSGSEGSDGEAAAGGDADPAEEGPPQTYSAEGAIVPSETLGAALVGGATEGDDDGEVCATLFKGLVFFLGREVPREQLLVVIRAFGGGVGWEGEGSPITESDESITHQVFDRPELKAKLPDREYVQPQWVVDSANFRVLADARLYGPSSPPPPHLSPFVDNDDEGYVPEYAVVLQRMQESARAMRKRAQGLAVEEEFLKDEAAGKAGDEAGDLAAAEKLYTAELSKELREKRKAEEDAELALVEEEPGAPAGKLAKDETEGDADEETMNKALMTRKDRSLYQSILKRQKAQRQKVKTLQKKRAKLAKEEASS